DHQVHEFDREALGLREESLQVCLNVAVMVVVRLGRATLGVECLGPVVVDGILVAADLLGVFTYFRMKEGFISSIRTRSIMPALVVGDLPRAADQIVDLHCSSPLGAGSARIRSEPTRLPSLGPINS